GKPGGGADLYTARRTTDGWTEPAPLGAINDPGADDLGPEPSPDGGSLYFYSDRAGGLGGYDLWVARRSSDGSWLAPVNLGPAVNSPFNEYGVALAAEASELYFASNRPRPGADPEPDADRWPATIREDRTARDYDLYRAAITDAGAGTPEPLDDLNTPFNEGSPAVTPFGDFLYFASDRPGGAGGFDLYRARRLRGGHTAPENLGAAVNSPANELDPALWLGGYALHFSSDRPRQTAEPDAEPNAAIASAPGEIDYDLYRSTSREVFLETDLARAGIDWALLAPWFLLWLLLLLLLLLLWLLRRTISDRRWRQLSLLAKCILASLLLHMLLLLAFTVWQVSNSIGDLLRPAGGSRVQLASAGMDDSLARQVRASATDRSLDLPPAPAPDALAATVTPIDAPAP
ncbi:MAG: hypothetical protein D6693_04255, partial [Planctomycetota bacterium]